MARSVTAKNSPQSAITCWLRAWGDGDNRALDQLIPLVHGELRRLARRRMSLEPPGVSLQPTALVNELYLRLVDMRAVTLDDRTQFYAMASVMMRRVLVDAARSRRRSKRGGNVQKVSFDNPFLAVAARDQEITALDDALLSLSKIDPRKARTVELRFFGGLTIEEVAGVLGISVQTVRRDWNFAQAWLMREMRADRCAPRS